MLGRKNIDGVATDTERSARELNIVTVVLHPHQLRNEFALS